MLQRVMASYRKRTERPFFTTEDRRNIAWFWHGYLKKRTPWLLVVLGLILLQGLAYQQFL